MDKKSLVRMSGAVYTPPEIAKALLSVVKNTLIRKPLNILEPSVGDGVFLHEMTESLGKHSYTVIDIDSEVIDNLKLSKKNDLDEITYENYDFLKYATNHIKRDKTSFDLVIGNPPFIRKHNFSDEFKDTLRNFAEIAEYPYSALKNSWVAFLVASSLLCSKSGAVAFVLPYELLTVDYGKKALRAMQEEFDCIDIFISKNRAFQEIEQDAVIFFGQRKSTDRIGLYINHVEQMSHLSSPSRYKLNLNNKDERGLELNTFLLSETSLDFLKKLRASCFRIEDVAGSAPGIVSAANNFFILKKTQVLELGLENYVLPILKKGSLASHNLIFNRDEFDQISDKFPCYLLNIKGTFEALDKKLQSYIKSGESEGLHLRYKCRHRKNWYEVPIVPREEGFVFKRSYDYPRVCMNDANVFLTDTAYGIRVKQGRSMRGICYSFYNSLTMLFSEIDGRFYGGGVLELSPKEFRGLPLVYQEPSDDDFDEFLEIHSSTNGNIEQILDFGDVWLKKVLQLNEEEMLILRNAWRAVRGHRLRHSGRNKGN